MSSQDKCSLADVQLVNKYGVKANNQGLLQVCQRPDGDEFNQWVLVCRNTDIPIAQDGVIHAACRQLGYIDAVNSQSIM